ncbi:MAG TPA: 1-acyl-sn-glycerol-3-phosphate acyltransferase, partial [Mucilaginibacter sp.]
MIYPEKNIIIRWFFSKYIPWIIRRNFQAVNFNEIEIDQDRSVLLIANHFSWWDAFLLYDVFDKLTGKKFHVMVIEETMKKHAFFKYIGAFSVNKNSREVIASLDYAAQLLNDPQNLVLLFPQGKLYSNFIDSMQFEKGTLKVMEQAGHKFQLIYAATFTEHLQYKKPVVNVYLNN